MAEKVLSISRFARAGGASEKFHGAVIDHYGGNDTRVFKEVSRVGEVLKELKELAGTTVNSSVAMLYDWDSQWAMEDSQGPRNKGLHYLEAMLKFYRGFRKQGVNVDVIDMTCELDKYKSTGSSNGLYVQGRFCQKGSCVRGKRRYTDHKLLVRNCR